MAKWIMLDQDYGYDKKGQKIQVTSTKYKKMTEEKIKFRDFGNMASNTSVRKESKVKEVKE